MSMQMNTHLEGAEFLKAKRPGWPSRPGRSRWANRPNARQAQPGGGRPDPRLAGVARGGPSRQALRHRQPRQAAGRVRAQHHRPRRHGPLGQGRRGGQPPGARHRPEHNVKSVVKSKSMVSEEMELNHALADAGIRAIETDLGEYLVQLAGQRPVAHRHARHAPVGRRRAASCSPRSSASRSPPSTAR